MYVCMYPSVSRSLPLSGLAGVRGAAGERARVGGGARVVGGPPGAGPILLDLYYNI